MLIKNFFFQNQKSDWFEKIKDFESSSYPRTNINQLNGKGEARESLDKFPEVAILFLQTIPCFDCIALCII